ncbi:MAG: hypothetical protein IPP83_07190 [Flavobacteriales bacterium]|nr:hypothetical protein [Flavobacteriales bacterium]
MNLVSSTFLRRSATIIVVPVLLLFHACGGSSAPEAAAVPESDPHGSRVLARTMSLLSAGDPYGTQFPYVGPAEFKCVTKDFGYHIHQGEKTSHGSISTIGSSLEFKVSELERIIAGMSVCADSGPVAHGIIVHYGLDAHFALAAVLQIQCLTYKAGSEEYTYAGSRDCYVIDTDGTLDFERDGITTWYGPRGNGATYAERVFIQHDAGGRWSPYMIDTDVHSTLFPYEGRIEDLIAQNGLSPSGSLRLVPMASPVTRVRQPDDTYVETGYHQGMLWVPVDVVLDDVENTAAPYKNKAADWGSPCPVTCPDEPFIFGKVGLAPRHTCLP